MGNIFHRYLLIDPAPQQKPNIEKALVSFVVSVISPSILFATPIFPAIKTIVQNVYNYHLQVERVTHHWACRIVLVTQLPTIMFYSGQTSKLWQCCPSNRSEESADDPICRTTNPTKWRNRIAQRKRKKLFDLAFRYEVNICRNSHGITDQAGIRSNFFFIICDMKVSNLHIEKSIFTIILW